MGRLTNEISRTFIQLGGNDSLPESIKQNSFVSNRILESERSWIAAIPFGLLGGFFGAFLVNTLRYIYKLPSDTTRWTWSVERNQSDPENIKTNNEQQVNYSPTGKRLTGLLGLLIGSLLAALGFTVVSLLRIIPQSIDSVSIGFLYVIARAEDKATDLDTRHWYLKTLGILGAILGGLIASLYFICIKSWKLFNNLLGELAQALVHFYKVTAWTIESILEAVLPGYKNSIAPNFQQWELFTVLGVVTGGVIGGIIALPVVLVRMITNSVLVFIQLSKTMINAGFQRELFKGTGIDVVKDKAHGGYGFLGYSALIVMLPVFTLIRLTRGLGPFLFNLFWALPLLIGRPIHELIKAITGQRLDNKGKLSDEDHAIIRKIFANKEPITGKIVMELPHEVPMFTKLEAGG